MGRLIDRLMDFTEEYLFLPLMAVYALVGIASGFPAVRSMLEAMIGG